MESSDPTKARREGIYAVAAKLASGDGKVTEHILGQAARDPLDVIARRLYRDGAGSRAEAEQLAAEMRVPVDLLWTVSGDERAGVWVGRHRRALAAAGRADWNARWRDEPPWPARGGGDRPLDPLAPHRLTGERSMLGALRDVELERLPDVDWGSVVLNLHFPDLAVEAIPP